MKVNYTLEQLNSVRAQGFGRAPLYAQTFADLATPIQVVSAVKERFKNCFLFESIEGGEKVARYSFIGFGPVAEIFLRDGQLTVARDGKTRTLSTRDPNVEIRKLLGKCRTPKIEGLPPFTGGLVGYFSYEYYKYYEKADFLPSGDFGDCRLMLFDKVIAYDNFSQKVYAIVNVDLGSVGAAEYQRAVADIADMHSIISNGGARPRAGAKLLTPFKMAFSREQYMAKVEQAKLAIREGEIFQCVPSNVWTAQLEGSLLNAYRQLRTTNPSPYMIYMSMGETELAGASPETLVKLSNGRAATFPIAGTRPRGRTDEEDRAMEADLLSDEKEVAEHNMLVDLGRNDLGKICKVGSVRVEDYKKIYRFSHIMHITSAVVGEVEEGRDVLDALAATLPAGTLSGAPKRRAMGIIAELEEGNVRGVYGGAVGYISFNGDGDFCIAIRTAAKFNDTVTVRAGGGIVADSRPESEFMETVNKSAAMREAIVASAQDKL